MPSLHHHSHYFVVPKIPFKPLFSFPFTTIASSTQNVSFHQSPSIIHKFLFRLQSFSKTLIWVKSIHTQITTNSDQFLASKLV
uniref:Putative pentatricopeptide repeat-containing protein n=1 Tax=Rhizophora mucronata TaxID=61149 RepID=A0A2P2P7G4_RHIMU